MSGIGVILNPHSRSNRRNPERLRRLAFIVGDKGSCHTTQDVLDVRKIAENFAARGVEVVCISGGDGTIHHTISTLIATYGARPLPMIALLRGGTINNVATALGIRGTPESILSRLILQYHEGESIPTTPVHCLCVNGAYGFLFGNGLVANFIDEYIRLGEGGANNALKLIARCVGSSIFKTEFISRLARRYDARVTVDGAVWPFRNYVIIQAGTVELFGFGIRPFPRAREQPGHFAVGGYSMTPREVSWGMVRLLRKKPIHEENALDTLASRVLIELTEPMTYMIDGEIYPATDRLEIGCGPVLQMVVV